MTRSASCSNSPLRHVLAAMLLASTASAAVIVVDDDGGPGVDYTDLPPAVAAAASGDLILVYPGSYTDFVLNKGLTILGTAAGVHIDHGTRITGLPAGQQVVLADLEPRDLRVLTSTGVVILESLTIDDADGGTGNELLAVDDCADVRMRGCYVEGPSFAASTRTGLRLDQSRLELVQSLVRGEDGPGTDCGSGGPGAAGMRVTNASRLHVSQSDVEGGEGGWVNYACPAFCNLGAGDGGTGLDLVGASVLYLMGDASNYVRGGGGGNGGACQCDGSPGIGLRVAAAQAIYSGALLQGGNAWCGGNGLPLSVSAGGSATQSVPADPYLDLMGAPATGAQVRFSVYGQPGDQATLFLGRFPALVPIPGVEIERLTTEERMFDLGTIGASGNASFILTVPAHLQTGFSFFGQGRVLRGGQELRTNSVPVVLR